ncbi:MAG: holo-ACP synthase [Nitrosopumilaceae archaeon]
MISITTGIDIVSVQRFRDVPFKNNKKFYLDIFDDEEIKYCLKFKDPYPYFAAKFAVKEAVAKAARKPIPMLEIHTAHGKDGSPTVKCAVLDGKELQVSLSHEKDIAVAIVISISQ